MPRRATVIPGPRSGARNLSPRALQSARDSASTECVSGYGSRARALGTPGMTLLSYRPRIATGAGKPCLLRLTQRQWVADKTCGVRDDRVLHDGEGCYRS